MEQEDETVTDTEKLKVIEKVLADAWEYAPQTKDKATGYYEGVLTCIDSILHQKFEEESK